MSLKAWLHSLAAAAIGGAATSLGAAVVSPSVFNFTKAGLEHLGAVALFGAIVPVLALLQKSPLWDASTSTTPVTPASDSSTQTTKLGVFALCLLLASSMFASGVMMTGCTSTDVQKAVTEIDAYLPTAIQLAQIVITAIGAAETQGATASLTSTGNTILSDLKELQTLTDAYLAQPTDSGWQSIQNLLETIITTNQSALEAATGIKSQDSKTTYIAAITGLSAALAVLDGYINSTKTVAQLKAKAQARKAKFVSQLQYWNDADRQRVAAGLHEPYSVVERQALAYGF